MNTKLQLLFFILLFFFSSCEEVIEIDLNSSNLILVAEGAIEPGEPATLRLSYTSDYFTEEATQYEEDAKIFLTDGKENYDTLVYEGDGLYRGENITGSFYTTYTIFVFVNENSYQASSVLLPAVKIRDVWFTKSTINSWYKDGGDYRIHVGITNDTNQDNYYLFKFYTNGELEDDKYSIANSSYYSNENYLEYNPTSVYFDKGDQVEVFVYRIDEDAYNYFSQLNDVRESGMGISSTPYNPQSNFGEDVLGYFYARSNDSHDAVVK